MTTRSADVIGTLIDSVRPIVSMERDGLVVIALGSAAEEDGPAYLTLAEATQKHGIDVHELGGGTVPEVEVETGADSVVIFGGDTIVGGKQNRIVNVTIWLAPGTSTHIPVTCLEAGRWDPGAEMHFAAGPRADLGMRRMLNTQVHASARATTSLSLIHISEPTRPTT